MTPEEAREALLKECSPWVREWVARHGTWPTGTMLPLQTLQDILTKPPGRDKVFWAFIEGLSVGIIVGCVLFNVFLWWVLG